MIFRRSRFDELVSRQLDLFASGTDLLDEAEKADAAWTNAAPEETEERYGDYQLVVDAIGEALHDIRESYASTLAESTADEYRGAFDRATSRRFGRYASFVDGEG